MRNDDNISTTDKISNAVNELSEESPDEIREHIIFLINELINNDFQSLVQLLYRIDVDEKKLKLLLKDYQQINSAPIIADLIIKRQMQKINTKRQFGKERPKDAEDNSW